jgi:hemolysin III
VKGVRLVQSKCARLHVRGAVRMETFWIGLITGSQGVYRGVVAVSPPSAPALPNPLLRGVLHQAAFSVSLVVGTLLIVGADGARRHVAAAVFAGSVAVCFGASALYHRVTWTPRLRLWMRRIDHTGVYLLIAGTYTPVCLLVLEGAWRLVVLVMVCVGAGAAIVLKFAWVEAPKWVAAVLGIALGWAGVAILPQLTARLNPAAVALLGVGGLFYTAGAIIYARRRPNPVPAVFGYHELFHALTLVAVACQYVAIAFFVIRSG